MTNEKRYIVEKIAGKLMKSCTIHDSGLFICILNKELDNYCQTEINKLNKSDVISSVCEHEKIYYCLRTGGMRCRKCKRCL